MAWIPTLGAIETGRDVRSFLKGHKEAFWRILKPLLPWMIGCYLLDALLTIFLMPPGKESVIGSLLCAYFYVCLAISWHRIVIDGPDNAVPMNPWKPQRHEWAFIGVGIGLYLSIFVVALIVGVIGALIHPLAIFILGFALLIAAFYVFCRLAIYFPAKAVNRSLTLKEAYALSHGLIWKMMGAPLVASWRLILGVAAYSFVLTFIVALILKVMGVDVMPVTPGAILHFLFVLPMVAYFEPMLYVLGVGCLSNYYLYAVQRGRISVLNSAVPD